MSDGARLDDSTDTADDESANVPPPMRAARLLLRLGANIAIMTVMFGCLQYWFQTRVQKALDEAWTGSATIVAGETYRDANGSPIIAKGEPFLAATDRLDSDESHVEQLRDAGYRRARVISHEVFSGLPDALRWAATSMATVGYADRRPAAGLGRLLAANLMFMSAAMLSALGGLLLAVAFPNVRSFQALRLPQVGAAAGSAAQGQASRRTRSFATTAAATVLLTMGHLLPPVRATLWFQLDGAGLLGALAIGLGALLWLALLAVAVGVYRGSHACALLAFLWWIVGGGVGLYAPSEWMATLHAQPPSVYEHAAWVVGAAFMMRIYNQALAHYVPGLRRRGSRPSAQGAT